MPVSRLGGQVTRILGGDKAFTLECKDFLGRILNKKRDYTQAERLHREVLDTKTSSPGGKIPFVGDTLQYLAECLLTQGKNTAACDFMEQSVRSSYENLGGDHPRTKEAVDLLVEIFSSSNKADEAVYILKSMGLTAEGNAVINDY